MADGFRDTGFGALMRALSKNKLLQYPDEKDASISKRFEARSASAAQDGDGDASSRKTEAGGEGDGPLRTMSVPDNVEANNQATIRIVEWYDDNDPENPQNWTSAQKGIVLGQMLALNFSVYVASSIYVPGEESIMEDFGVKSVTVATLGLSLYTVGYGLGPMLWSPMSELPQLGRSRIYLYTLVVYVLLQLGTGFAVDMPMFLVFRLISGVFGSPSLVNAAATIGDIYDPARTAYGVCTWAAFAVCGPIFGPLIGGFAAPAEGWRWTIWIYTWLVSLCLTVMFFLLPETSAANILYRRAKRLRAATGDDSLRSRSEIDDGNQTLRDRYAVLGRAFILLFTEPIVFVMDTFTALVYGVLFIWFESFPIVFGGIYGFSIQDQGLAYLGLFVGLLVVIPSYLLWVKRGVIPAFERPGFKPEMMLPPTFVGSIAFPLCLFWYGWTARESIPWIVPVIATALFPIGVITIFNAVFNYLSVAYLPYSASVFAGNALFRASFAASFPLFARFLFDNLGVGPGNSLLAGIAVMFIPISFALHRYGSVIRHKSKNARHDV